jgi:hypothetical protein
VEELEYWSNGVMGRRRIAPQEFLRGINELVKNWSGGVMILIITPLLHHSNNPSIHFFPFH